MAPPSSGSGTRTERRFARRYPLDVAIEIEWGSTILPGRARDLSASGLFVELSDPLWLGARFMARLALDPPVQLECVVRRVHPGSGMAVTFVPQDELGLGQINALLAHLAKT